MTGWRRCTAVALALWPAMAQAGPWDDYQLIMWQERSAVQTAGLVRLGFTGAKLRGTGGRVDEAGAEVLRGAGLLPYIENIATDFYAPYHRYAPDKPVTWLFDAARQRRAEAPGDRGVFAREPGLSDPAWLAVVAARLRRVVQQEAADRPLFYNLGDETGIADLSANWDFDLSPTSLAAMRVWLRGEYGTLDALNRQWGTQFAAWGDVVPELTDATLARTDGNHSGWADFKAFMDVAFAAALRAGTDAVHEADPAALAAIEGAQVPGWGGYDYGRLAGAVDVMEIYDSGNALDLAHAFNPALIPLRTSFGTGPRETHDAWRNLLRGGRGTIVWDEANDTVAADGSPAPRGAALAKLTADIRAVAPAIIASRAVRSPVAVLYSQASFRTRWLLDQAPRGAAWSDRDAERELDDNAWRAARRQAADRLRQLGLPPRWLSTQMVEAGALARDDLRVLMLPHAIALSDREVSAIRAFAARGGLVLADTEPGVFDGHSRRRGTAPLAGIASMKQVVRPDAEPASASGLAAFANLLGVTPPVTVTGPDGLLAAGVDIHLFQNGAVTLVALQAMRPFEAPGTVTVRLRGPAMLRNMRQPGPAQDGNAAAITLDPIEPTILSVSPSALPTPVLTGPAAAMAGASITWHLALDGPTPAEVHAVRLQLLGPGALAVGDVVRLGAAGTDWTAVLPAGAAGAWTVRAWDMLGGGEASLALCIGTAPCNQTPP